ncbi:hydroxymethylbilane synthase, partial [Bordetella pertussis]
DQAQAIGESAARDLLADGADAILAELLPTSPAP